MKFFGLEKYPSKEYCIKIDKMRPAEFKMQTMSRRAPGCSVSNNSNLNETETVKGKMKRRKHNS